MHALAMMLNQLNTNRAPKRTHQTLKRRVLNTFSFYVNLCFAFKLLLPYYHRIITAYSIQLLLILS